MIKIKRMITSLILVCALMLMACAAPDTQTADQEPEASAASETASPPPAESTPAPQVEAGNTLADYDGWWHRPEGYVPEGISLVDTLRIDSAEGTWIAYDSLGNETYSNTIACEGGALLFSFDLGDFIFIAPDTETMLNEDGGVEFVRGEAMAPPDTASYAGKWYLNGDVEGDYYELADTAYSKWRVIYGEAIQLREGTWSLRTTSYYAGGVELPDQLTIEVDEMMGPTLHPTMDGKVLVENDFSDYACYVHESAIGTQEAALAPVMGLLMDNDWTMYNADGSSVYLRLSYPPLFALVTYPPGGGEGTVIGEGTWRMLDDTTAKLAYVDGSTENVHIAEVADGGKSIWTLTTEDGSVYYSDVFAAQEAIANGN